MIRTLRSFHGIFLGLLFSCLCFGCRNDIGAKVDMAGHRISPGQTPIAIGKTTDIHAWDQAARVPFPPDGEAELLWDDKGVYGRLNGKSQLKLAQEDESICVSLDDSVGTDELYAVKLNVTCGESVKSGFEIAGRFTGIPPAELPQAQFSGGVSMGQVTDEPWEAEFFVPWKLLCGSDGPQGKLFVHVYRIAGERPYSFLELDLPGK